MSYINVIVKDAVRIVNWDYEPETTIEYVINQLQFKPIPGTVRAGDMEVRDLSAVRLCDCPMEIAPNSNGQKRVRITMETVKPKKKPVPAPQSKEVKDVR